jgi:hypothetical protein
VYVLTSHPTAQSFERHGLRQCQVAFGAIIKVGSRAHHAIGGRRALGEGIADRRTSLGEVLAEHDQVLLGQEYLAHQALRLHALSCCSACSRGLVGGPLLLYREEGGPIADCAFRSPRGGFGLLAFGWGLGELLIVARERRNALMYGRSQLRLITQCFVRKYTCRARCRDKEEKSFGSLHTPTHRRSPLASFEREASSSRASLHRPDQQAQVHGELS